MNFFERLPVELCELVSQCLEVPIHAGIESPHSLSILSRLSKRNHSIFTPFLYRKLETSSLTTLATSQSSRAPLKGPHPASFVKNLRLEFPGDEKLSEEGRKSLSSFRMNVRRAMANVIAHASADGPLLQTFVLICPFLSFPELLGKVNLATFARLSDVSIRCEFPRANIRKCLKMLTNICNPSLTCLILDLSLRDKAPPLEPRYVSEIIQQIGDDCPGLTDFGIGFPNPEQQHSVELITSALNSIRFPNLKYLDLGYDGDPNSPSGLALDWNQFLLNHPTVEDLQYRHSRALPDCLPRLKAFKGAFDCRDVLSLGAYRLLSALELEVYQPWDINDVVNFRLTLQEMPLLQTLVLSEDDWDEDWANHGLGILDFRSLVEACPKLTSLECHVKRICNMDTIYECIADTLPRIQHLDLTIYSQDVALLCAPAGPRTPPMRMVDLECGNMSSRYNVRRIKSLQTIDVTLCGWLNLADNTKPPDFKAMVFFDMRDKDDGSREVNMVGFK